MREDLLHFIWKYKKLSLEGLITEKKEPIDILEVGTHNHLAGPDFFNAKIKIGSQLWAGNVEIHLKSSDWYVHGHEKDSNYNNVILHVVWEDDGSVFRSDGSEIPTLELKNYISTKLLSSYRKLFDKRLVTFINCEKDIAKVDAFLVKNWLERLYFDRLERKSEFIFNLLEVSNNDWERVLFTLLLKNFGLKVNGDSFLSLSSALDFSVVRKLRVDTLQLESVLYGMVHLLEDSAVVDEYYLQLRKEYDHFKNKFDLKEDSVLKPEFFKLRPANFPTIRLSQLANLYSERQNLFSKVISATSLDELYRIFKVAASPYWNDHFTFGKTSKKSIKDLTKKFIDLLIINAILPVKFCHARHLGKDANEEIINIISEIASEENSIIHNFKKYGVSIENAKDSQAILQLYNNYCTKNNCLQCAIGSSLLYGNG